MKLLKKFLPPYMIVCTAFILGSCSSGTSDQNASGGNVGPTKEPSTNDARQPVQPSTSRAAANTDAESGTEITDTPVYAVWVARKDDNKMYDGMYDSASGYLRLCDSKQMIHVDDPGNVLVNASKSCYSQGNTLKMITIKKGISGKPLFLTVLHVDPVGRNLVALTDNNDTIVTSAATMNPAAFDQLKKQYQVTPFSAGEVDKIKHYYSPEMQVQNAQKKAQVMKMNAVMLKK
jgi:hypothetical protein